MIVSHLILGVLLLDVSLLKNCTNVNKDREKIIPKHMFEGGTGSEQLNYRK